MNNSFNKTELNSTSVRLSDDYKQQDNDPVETITIKSHSEMESQNLSEYVSAMRNNSAETVTFSLNIDTKLPSEEIRKLNALLEDEPILTFVSSDTSEI